MDDRHLVDADRLLHEMPRLRALAGSLVRNAADADDITQDAVLAALRSPASPVVAVRAWLRQAVRNLARLTHRRDEHRKRRERHAAQRDDGEDAARLVERFELMRMVAEAVHALDEPYRSTVLLRFLEDLTPSGIAERQGVPPSTVRNRLKRALERVRQDLDARHGGERSRWLHALAPIAAHPAVPLAISPGLALLRGWLMTQASKTALVVVLVGTASLLLWHTLGPNPKPRGGADPQAAVVNGANPQQTSGVGTSHATDGSGARSVVAADVAADLSVLVIDDQDRPVAGSRVRFVWADAGIWREATTRTDADGVAQPPWPQRVARLVQVYAEPEGRAPAAMVWDTNGNAVVRVHDTLHVRGRVRDAVTGAPIVRATAGWQFASALIYDQYSATGESARDGVFTLSVPAGVPCWVDCYHEDHQSLRLWLPPMSSQADADRADLDVRLFPWRRGWSTRARVTDAQGHALTDLELSSGLFTPHERRALPVAGEPGTVRIPFFDGRTTFVWALGLGPGLMLDGGSTDPFSLELRASQSLEVDIASDEGAAIAGTIDLSVQQTSPSWFDVRPGGSWRLVRASLPMRIPLVNDWQGIELHVSGAGFAPADFAFTPSDVPAGESVVRKSLSLAREEHPLQVRVVDREGTPIVGALVSVGDLDPATRLATCTDSAGHATLELGMLGRKNLRRAEITKRGFVGAAFDVPRQMTCEVLVTLVVAQHISGRVLDDTAQAVPDAAIGMELDPSTRSDYPEPARCDGSPIATKLACWTGWFSREEDALPTVAHTDALGAFTIDDLPAQARIRIGVDSDAYVLPAPLMAEVGKADLLLRVARLRPVVFRFPDMPPGGYGMVEIRCEPAEDDPKESNDLRRLRVQQLNLGHQSATFATQMLPGLYHVSWRIAAWQDDGPPNPTRGQGDALVGSGLTVIDIR